MRKLEGLVKEIQDEMDYLKKREMRFQSTNGRSTSLFVPLLSPTPLSPVFVMGPLRPGMNRRILTPFPAFLCRIDQLSGAKFRAFHVCDACLSWDVADFPSEEFLPEEVLD